MTRRKDGWKRWWEHRGFTICRTANREWCVCHIDAPHDAGIGAGFHYYKTFRAALHWVNSWADAGYPIYNT